MFSNKVTILDTTLRDGAQIPGVNLFSKEKIKIAHLLEELQVDVIEAGFAASSIEEQNTLRQLSNEIEYSELCSLSRSIETDIYCAAKSLEKAKRKRIHLFIGTSDIHLEYQLNKTHTEVLDIIYRTVCLAKQHFEVVQWSPMDASRTSFPFLSKAIAVAVEAGASVINYADTLGFETPFDLQKKVSDLIKLFPQVSFSAHCHNDLGLANANSLAALQAGAKQIECTIAGIGERAGNAALEELVMAMFIRSDLFKYECGIKKEKLYLISKEICQLMNLKISRLKPIIGKNAFSHASGIHQDGILKNPKTYELFEPKIIGRKKNELVISKFSGHGFLKERLQQLGFNCHDEDIQHLMLQIKDYLSFKKRISNHTIKSMLQTILNSK